MQGPMSRTQLMLVDKLNWKSMTNEWKNLLQMAGSRDFFLCGAGRRFSVIRVPRGSEIVMLDGRRTRAADSEGNPLSVQSGSLCLCFHAASDSLGACRGRCRNRKWRPYWLTPGLSHREQITELRLPLPALHWKIFQLPLSPETCCEPRPRVCSPSWSQVRLLPTWVSPAAVWHLEDFLWSVNYARWVKLQLLLNENGLASALYTFGFDLLARQKVKHEVTVWKQFPHVRQMKRWTTGPLKISKLLGNYYNYGFVSFFK